MTVATRTFSEDETVERDAHITARIEDDCDGCVSRVDGEGYENWTPAQTCPVHGEHCEPWWAALNDELDARWPGAWSA